MPEEGGVDLFPVRHDVFYIERGSREWDVDFYAGIAQGSDNVCCRGKSFPHGAGGLEVLYDAYPWPAAAVDGKMTI